VNRAADSDPLTILNVLISGGGPVGLSFALLLEELMGKQVSIKIYDGRWEEKEGSIVWKSTESGNARRQQVVTIQSRQYLHYSPAIRERLFQKDSYSEMWPEGSDSVQGYPPRNIRIAELEDRFLEISNEKNNITLIPTWFKVKEQHETMLNHHIVAICEGGQSRTRTFFMDKFGQADKSMYSIEGEHLQDVILGLRVKSELSDPMSVLLTVAQNRFLLNSLDGEGFLNMRLTDDEVKEVVGIDTNGKQFDLKVCIQSQPCLMEIAKTNDVTKAFACPTHGTLFLPALLRVSPLWERIQEGLKLFAVNPKNLTAVTAFRLDMVQRPRFSVQLYPATTSHSATFGFLLGDAANAIHFWSGRGLNSGIASIVSLARCLKQKWPAKPFRDADFIRHEGIMSMLQYRHKSRAWHTMTETDSEGCTVAIKQKIADAITAKENGDLNKQVDVDTLMNRLIQIKQGLRQRIHGFPDDETLRKHLNCLNASTLRVLVMSNRWNTVLMAGEEIDVDLLFPEIEESIDIPFMNQMFNIENNHKEDTFLASLVYEKEANISLNLIPKLDIAYNTEKIRIGRNKRWSDLYLNDISISRKHALILINKKQELIIQDQGSVGGTYINQQRLRPHTLKKLQHNDEISFSGYITYTVKI